MPWNYDDYPPSMNHMEPHIREKAIDIGNALMEQGYTVATAVPIAITQARRWAEGDEGKIYDRNYHVVPHAWGWAVQRATGGHALVVVETEGQARNYAIQYALTDNVDVIVHDKDSNCELYIDLLSISDAHRMRPATRPVIHDQSTSSRGNG